MNGIETLLQILRGSIVDCEVITETQWFFPAQEVERRVWRIRKPLVVLAGAACLSRVGAACRRYGYFPVFVRTSETEHCEHPRVILFRRSYEIQYVGIEAGDRYWVQVRAASGIARFLRLDRFAVKVLTMEELALSHVDTWGSTVLRRATGAPYLHRSS